ncbi:uncharacterized protein Dsimw501_GD26800 [Drosophila simulans]|nr:uncharacterized protein Dsimw501_GD26800 [Drosophila simulans]
MRPKIQAEKIQIHDNNASRLVLRNFVKSVIEPRYEKKRLIASHQSVNAASRKLELLSLLGESQSGNLKPGQWISGLEGVRYSVLDTPYSILDTLHSIPDPSGVWRQCRCRRRLPFG